MTSISMIATAAEKAVREDSRAGMLKTDIDRYEAAQIEIAVRAEYAGIHMSRLQLKTLAAKVAGNAQAA